MAELATISGEILDLRMFGDWGLGKVLCKEPPAVHTICGKALAGLAVDPNRSDRNKYELTGVWKNHPKYGEQFEVAGVLADVDPTRDALIKFLVRHYQGCGVRTADAIVEWFKQNGGLDDLREILVRNPESLPQHQVLAGRKKPLVFQDDSGATMETQVYRRLAVQLGGRGIADPVLRRLATYLYAHNANTTAAKNGCVDACWKNLRADPYRPIRYCDGYGFQTAEIVAGFFDFPKDAPERLGAIAYFVLDDACKGKGHAYLTKAEYAAEVAALDPGANFGNAVNYARQQGLPVIEDNGRYYLTELLAAEKLVSYRLSLMIRATHAPIYTESDAFLQHAVNVAEQDKGDDFKLDPSQRAALVKLLTSRTLIHTLTAGPGTGKTAIMELMCQIAAKVPVCFLAPTGKAAKVLHGRVLRYGREAMTIHRALEPGGDGVFQRNAANPLTFRVIVVDEASMVDLALMACLLDACKDDTHIILIGDEDQLPSVGPGRLLEDVCLLPGDHNRLTKTHRNTGGILDLVRLVREGEIRDDKREDVCFEGDMGDPETGFEGRVMPAYQAAIARAGIANVCLVMARRKGKRELPAWNVNYANGRLQDTINPERLLPPGPRRVMIDEIGVKVPDAGYFRIGDRIMIRKNLLLAQNPDENDREVEEDEEDAEPRLIPMDPVVNGDTGAIFSATMNAAGALRHVSLELDDGRMVHFPVAYLDYLTLSYATTVHAAQGSEYSEVILVLTNGHPDFVHRKIVYTAVSRPRDRLTIFGAPWVLSSLVKRPGPDRNSGLIDRVKACAPDLDFSVETRATQPAVPAPVMPRVPVVARVPAALPDAPTGLGRPRSADPFDLSVPAAAGGEADGAAALPSVYDQIDFAEADVPF